MSSGELRALTFDVFGTVVDWRTSVTRELVAVGASSAIEADWVAFADAWRGRYQPSMTEVREGRRRFAKLDVLHRESLVDLLEEFGVAGLDAGAIDRLNHAWHRLDPWPDSVAGLDRLRRRHVLGALSNGNVSLIVDLARHAGLRWDVVLGAEIARQYKPLPEVYLNALDLLDVAPRECMLVAAHNSDLAAAQALGMCTGFVARPTEHGPGQHTDLEPEGPWDVIASDFHDLATQLGC